MDLININKKNYLSAVNNLKKHVNNIDIFDSISRRIFKGIRMDEKLIGKTYRGSICFDCNFNSVDLTGTGFAGSRFVSSIFNNCNITGTNFNNCDFYNVKYMGSENIISNLLNASFTGSTFSYSTFSNLKIESCGFGEAIFSHSIFENCTIRLCNLENTQFVDCIFKNCIMYTLNLEYTEFRNVEMVDTILPFHHLESSFGILNLLDSFETTYIYSATANNHKISISDYKELLSDFLIYHKTSENFFPLANIYIYMGLEDKATESILYGMLQAIQYRDFRSLKYFCKLIYVNDFFSIKQRKDFYEKIIKWISDEHFTLSEYHNYQLASMDIQNYLLKDDCSSYSLRFWIKTNIEPNEKEKQVVFLSIIDEIIQICDISDYSIEISHNSPYLNILNIICNDITVLSTALIMVYGSIGGITLFFDSIFKTIEKVQGVVKSNDEHLISKQQIIKLSLENKNIEIENEFLENLKKIEYQTQLLEYQKLALEYEELNKKINAQRQIIISNDIKATISHTSKNIDNPPFKEIINYQSSNDDKKP